jgi:hypothetical protein
LTQIADPQILLNSKARCRMLIGNIDKTHSSRIHKALPNGFQYWKSTLISTSNPGQRPNAFLVEQPPSSTLATHFHTANQFQVFVHGSGRLGRHKIAPVTVHYTNAFSPYGPINSLADGLHYYTFRDDYDPGARFLPEAILDLQKTKRRYATSVPLGVPLERPITTERRFDMIPLAEDGVAAIRVDAPSGATVMTEMGSAHSDRYILVLTGEIDCTDAVVGARACIFLAQDEAPSVTARDGGACFLLLQFPKTGPWKPDGSGPNIKS